MNRGFSAITLSGNILDVGGGRNPDYFDYFQKKGKFSVEAIDGSFSGIDFEKDKLPYADTSFDIVVCANVLEHVYNYNFLIAEMHRVLKGNGEFIGFVPFLMQYHPDPHDYFRYTKEALVRMCTDAGFGEIRVEEVGGGPFFSNFNTLVLSIPHICRAIAFPFYWTLDAIFLTFRPRGRERYPLGYIITAQCARQTHPLQ